MSCQLLPEEVGSSRTLVKRGDKYLVGTIKNSIVCGDNLSDMTSVKVVTQGHYGELWGLAEHNSSHHFFTCAYDNHVKLWDAAEHRALWDITLSESLHCVSVSHDGELLAVGSRTPNWYVYQVSSQQQLASGSCGSEQLECCEFSPGKCLLTQLTHVTHSRCLQVLVVVIAGVCRCLSLS